MEVIRKCPVCQGEEYSLLWNKAATSYVRCGSCPMVFVDPCNRSFIDGSFYQDRTESFYLAEDKLRADHDPIRFVTSRSSSLGRRGKT